MLAGVQAYQSGLESVGNHQKKADHKQFKLSSRKRGRDTVDKLDTEGLRIASTK